MSHLINFDKDSENTSVTDLMIASRDGNIPKVKKLLKKEKNIDRVDEYGRTALLYAIEGKHPDVVKLLLDHGADPEIRDESEEKSALSYAVEVDCVKCAELLIKKGADPNDNGDGYTPLMRAARYGQYNMVRTLIKYGADINAKDEEGRTALSWAKENQEDLIVEYLVGHQDDE